MTALTAGTMLAACSNKSNSTSIIGPSSTQKKSMKLSASEINHSVCQWCYSGMPIEELIDHCKDMGIKSVELLGPDDWDKALLRGLTCAVSNGSSLGIPKGLNDRRNHNQIQKEIMEIIPKAADKGIPSIICFSGNRNGVSDALGMDICAQGLNPIVEMAEKYNVQIVMELLNSKVDHKDYMCDHTSWGADLVEKVGSPNFKLLYDIYHMQIMEGDIIRTIKNNHQYVGHYHTGGVPGRNEIDETQELYYPAIMKAIVDVGYKGYVAQEFIPSRDDNMASLRQGVEICNV
jgi:hydroxypyruvate isomerase